jgi:ADP-heptose:LPS heptosyltransferase
VILLGGKEDRAHGKFITTGLMANKRAVYNACGEYTIHQSASILRQANLVVSNDTGLMHISAALRKKVISIWGNTIPEFGMYPYYGYRDIASATIEVSDLPCRPCSKIGYDDCPKRHFKCMKGIRDKEVVEAIQKLY